MRPAPPLQGRVSLLSAAAMLCLAIYLMGEALGALATDLPTWASWLRRTWWAPSLALPIWLTLSLALTIEEGPPAWAATTRSGLCFQVGSRAKASNSAQSQSFARSASSTSSASGC